MTLSLCVPGAVPADPPDDAVAGHYGDPYREQVALELGATVDRSHRGVVVVEGPDRLSWLHALTTQWLVDLPPGVPTETMVLSPHGHVEHHAEVLDDGERTWLLVEPGTAPALARWLDSMRFMTRVEVRDETERLATLTVAGDHHVAGAVLVRPRSWPAGTVDVLVPRAEAELTGPLAGHDAFEALRIAAGRPRLGVDTDHRTLVHEVGWLGSALHLEKGCYRGQETVARVHNLGRPPRRLALVHLDGSEHLLPARGSELLTADGRPAGTLTSAARHHELGPIGLGLLRRAAGAGPLVTADGVAVAVERDLSSPTQPVVLRR